MADPTFKKRFGITTPIKYSEKSTIVKGEEARFARSWKRLYNRFENTLSETREKSFETLLKRIERAGTDAFLCEKLAIRYIGKKIGYGVFAKENIAPYTVLGFYTGIFSLESKMDENSHSTFEFTDFKRYCLAAEKAGNWTRFMNHSESGNVIAWEFFRKNMPYMFFTAGSKGVKKGAQLLYSYGDKYWEDDDCKSL